jgi:hypothetical protein
MIIITELETNYENLVSNVTSISESTVRTSEFFQLRAELNVTQRTLTVTRDTLAGTQESLYNATTMVSELKTEFKDLVSNVTSLAESTVRTSDFLQLSAALNITRETLANTQQTLNVTRNDLTDTQVDLYNATTIISELKTDFEVLVSNVTSISESTVRTSEFLQLSETVYDLTEEIQENISRLNLNVSNQIRHINTTLTSKADEHDVDILTERVTTLSVTLTAFETLKENVQSLRTSKADQTSLDQLESTVNDLDETTAKQQDLHRLDEKVSSHISLSERTHSHYDSRISESDGAIRSNTAHITSVENDVRQLKDSTPGLTASWMIASMAVSMVIVCVY